MPGTRWDDLRKNPSAAIGALVRGTRSGGVYQCRSLLRVAAHARSSGSGFAWFCFRRDRYAIRLRGRDEALPKALESLSERISRQLVGRLKPPLHMRWKPSIHWIPDLRMLAQHTAAEQQKPLGTAGTASRVAVGSKAGWKKLSFSQTRRQDVSGAPIS